MVQSHRQSCNTSRVHRIRKDNIVGLLLYICTAYHTRSQKQICRKCMKKKNIIILFTRIPACIYNYTCMLYHENGIFNAYKKCTKYFTHHRFWKTFSTAVIPYSFNSLQWRHTQTQSAHLIIAHVAPLRWRVYPRDQSQISAGVHQSLIYAPTSLQWVKWIGNI